jgi:hypothetical protein
MEPDKKRASIWVVFERLNRARQPDRGFILLTSIWILVLGSALTAALMLQTRNSVVELKNATQLAMYNQALLSARDQVIADIIVNGKRGRWASGTSAIGQIAVGNASVDVDVTNEGGRLDLLSADAETLKYLFATLDLPDRDKETALASLIVFRDALKSDHRAIRSPSELLGLNGWTPELMDCLADMITIHTGMGKPSPLYASRSLLRILGTERVTNEGDYAMGISAAGEIYRIVASTHIKDQSTTTMTIVRITGNSSQPYWTLETEGAAAPLPGLTCCR